METPNQVICECCELSVPERLASADRNAHGLIRGWICRQCNEHRGDPLKTARDHEYEVRVRWGENRRRVEHCIGARCCTLHTGRAHARAAIPAVLDAVAAGFDPSIVTSEVVPVADAVEALAHPPLKLVIDCASPPNAQATQHHCAPTTAPNT